MPSPAVSDTRTGDGAAYYRSQAEARYRLEPWIAPFARFSEGRGRRVLEMGTGMGADHLEWVRSGADAFGIDFAPGSVQHTADRLRLDGRSPRVLVADGEQLPFPSSSFDLIYSWGVAHHSPDTERFVAEAARVLRPGGSARFAIYHTWSWGVGLIWLRHGLLRGRLVSAHRVIAEHLESPGTRLYSRKQARQLFERHFGHVEVHTQLGLGDLLTMAPSAKYQDRASRLAIRLWPRPLIRRLGHRFGGYLLIEAER